MSSTSSTTPNQPQPADDSAAAAATLPVNAGGEIITVLVIVLFLLFLIALVLYLRTKHCPGTIGSYSRRPGLSFASPPGLLLRRRPLELSVLNSLPVVTFDVRFENSELGLECAVCLSEFNGGEKARFLPNCNHGFHVECVDMWFASNSTCPLCRLPVEDVPHVLAISSDEAGSSSTACSSPDQKQEEKGMMVIDMPEQEGSSPTLAPLAIEIEVKE